MAEELYFVTFFKKMKPSVDWKEEWNFKETALNLLMVSRFHYKPCVKSMSFYCNTYQSQQWMTYWSFVNISLLLLSLTIIWVIIRIAEELHNSQNQFYVIGVRLKNVYIWITTAAFVRCGCFLNKIYKLNRKISTNNVFDLWFKEMAFPKKWYSKQPYLYVSKWVS